MEAKSASEKKEFEPNEATRLAWNARAHLLRSMDSKPGSAQARGAFDLARSSFEEAVRLTEPALLKRALVGTYGQLEDAQDLLQDVYIKAFRALPGLRGDSQVETWLHRSLLNKLADYYEARARRPNLYSLDDLHSVDDEEVLVEVKSIQSTDIYTDPEQRAIHSETLERVLSVLADLTPDSRRVVFLRYILGLSHSEIGQVLGLHINNSKILAMRGLEKLRRQGE